MVLNKKLLPIAYLNFLRNQTSLHNIWQRLLENLHNQILLLDSCEALEKIEVLIAKEDKLIKEIVYLNNFLETSYKDLKRSSCISMEKMKDWQKEQKIFNQQYLSQKSLITTKLKILQSQLKIQQEENKKKRIIRSVKETYTKASIIDTYL